MSGTFTCNICGRTNDRGHWHREVTLCLGCGSNARFRAMVAGLSIALFNKITPLPEMVPDHSIRGFGCSDSECYGQPLAALFHYTNTFLHTPPRADIGCAETLAPYGGCDFILCSEILEHVLCSPSHALRNMRDCLKPGGSLIFSAPSYEMTETVEKYPPLECYRSIEIGDRSVVVYQTMAGTFGLDASPVYHGGPGSVLEMRLFSHSALLDTVKTAGFTSVTTVGEEAAAFGATWPVQVDRHDLDAMMNGTVIVARR